MKINDEHMFEYTPVQWRFSGVTPSVFGLDPIIVIAGPALMFGLSKQYGLFYFLVLAAFVLICVYVSIFTDYRNVSAWLHALRTRYIQRCQWETE